MRLLKDNNKLGNLLPIKYIKKLKFRPILILGLLVYLAIISFKIYQKEQVKKEIKEDLIEISNIKYGLFNVDEWKIILSNILTKKVEQFEIDSTNRSEMKKSISDFLYKLTRDLEKRFHAQNTGISGFFRSAVANITNIFEKMQQDVPIFTNQILNFMNDPRNKRAVKEYLIEMMNDYADSTFSKMEYTLHDAIIDKYQCSNRADAIDKLNLMHGELQKSSDYYKYTLLILAILTAMILFFAKTLKRYEFILLTFVSLTFLILGLTLPMIEIDARVSEIKLSLLGENIHFIDQVLYYKSKSILEMIHLMLTQRTFDLFLVGFLVLLFSVLFPISKLAASIYVVLNTKVRKNKIINFLVNKTGKWSMADVMVVAIFMSYIGFSGILTEQLHQLEHLSTSIEMLTTNKSHLQIGFFSFTAFALLSLLTTTKLHKNYFEQVQIIVKYEKDEDDSNLLEDK